YLPIVVGLRQKISQTVQSALPYRTAILDPLLEGSEASRIELASAHSPRLLGGRRIIFMQHLEVLNHRRQRDVERSCKARNRLRAVGEPLHNGPPGGITESVKYAVDIYFSLRHGSRFFPTHVL